jgi:nucleoside-specific outer membrane channel protein Tsx
MEMMNKYFLAAAAALASVAMAPLQAAEVYQATSASIAYTDRAKFDPVYGTGTDDRKLTTFRLEHYGIYGLGDNYLAAEIYRGTNVGNIPTFPGAGSFGDNTQTQSFLVFNPRISLSKVSGKKFTFGFVKDVYAAARFEWTSYANFRSTNLGLSVDLDVPGAAFFETDLYYREAHYTGNTVQGGNLFSRTVFIFPIAAGPVKANLTALLLVNKRRDANGTEVFFQPDLMFPIGASGLEVGYRHEIHHYRNYNRVSPTVVAKWNF